MATRIISAAIGIAFVLAVIFAGGIYPIIIDIFIALVCAVAAGEFIHAVGLLKKYEISVPSIAFSFFNALLYSYGYQEIIWYAYTAVILSALIFFHKKLTFREVLDTYGMIIIISYGLAAVIAMKNLDTAHSVFYFVLALALPWLADGGAYFAGSFFGRHKLCSISPKKTIEGVIGGVICCVICCCLAGFIFSCFIYTDIQSVNYVNLIILSLSGSLLSVLGDLIFSLVKRAHNIKDYGNLIPGHGGVLDRFDSVVIVAPFLNILLKYLPVL